MNEPFVTVNWEGAGRGDYGGYMLAYRLRLRIDQVPPFHGRFPLFNGQELWWKVSECQSTAIDHLSLLGVCDLNAVIWI